LEDNSAVSEELENSLQQAIESYLGERLRAINEQLSQLQTEFNETLARLRESSVSESLSGTSLSAAVFAHLQAARGQKLSGETAPAATDSSTAAALKHAVEDLGKQHSQSSVLKSLMTGAVQFAERAALFVVKNDQVIGWRVCEASDPTNLELIGGVSLPLSAETLLSRAFREKSAWSGTSDTNSDDRLLLDQLGGGPKQAVAVPLVVRGKVVALLYADAVSTDPDVINVDALEVLARVAAMGVNLVSMPRTTRARTAPEAVAAPTPAAREASAVPAAEAVAEPEPEYAPTVEPATPVEAISAKAPSEPAAEAEFAAPEAAVTPVEVIKPEPAPAAEVSVAAEEKAATPADLATADTQELAAQPAPAEPEAAAPIPKPAPEPAPAAMGGFTPQYSTPLGSSRRFGISEPDLPLEVGEEERRLHNDARRFARLLVSEIKLYNEPKVREGRSNSDLYDRLREDIDRSRQMYDKRVAPPVAARHDYFHQELVNTLAEGDPAKLGGNYPGAMVGAS
jgi:hypothetical protein